MNFVMVIFFLLDGQWVEGDPNKGWGRMPFPTEIACLTSKARAEDLQVNLKLTNPRVTDKRFECIEQGEAP